MPREEKAVSNWWRGKGHLVDMGDETLNIEMFGLCEQESVWIDSGK